MNVKLKRLLMTVFLLMIICIFSVFSKNAVKGAVCGITLCLTHIVPSLFPFLIIAEMICNYSFSQGSFIYSLLVGNISGYPIGGKLCSSLNLTGRKRFLSLIACIGAGPGFTVAAVGTGVLKSQSAGVLLFASQILTSLTAAAVFFLLGREKKEKQRRDLFLEDIKPFGTVLTDSVTAACLSCLYICGFVTFFSCIIGIGEVLIGNGLCGMIIGGILEVSNGCGRASLVYGLLGFSFLGFILGFGGLCVLCQIWTFVRKYGITFKELLLSRLVSGLLGFIYSALLYISFPCFIPTASFDTHLNKTALHPISLTVTLCIMLGVLLCADKRTGGVRIFGDKGRCDT